MRYVPHTDDDRREMLAAIGVDTLDDLFTPIPPDCRAPENPEFPGRLSEPELIRHLTELAGRNRSLGSRPSFLGGGCYRHYIPPIVDALASRGEFLTAYTPYQAEASQGTLQAIFEFQSMVAGIAGLPLSNASLYDGASGLVEAILMIRGSARGKDASRDLVLLSKGIHPDYRATVHTYLRHLPLEVQEVDLGEDGQTGQEALAAAGDRVLCFCFQSPSFLGTLEDATQLASAAHAIGAKVVQVFSPLASMLVTSPGEAGVDVAVGEGQCLGNVPNYGGPHLGLFCAKAEYMRKLPGRIVGRTQDLDGRPAYVLTLQTREQHIRREKATSNICTNVGLIALRATIYLATLGKRGLREVARICLERAHHAARAIASLEGFALRYPDTPFFHEVAIRCPGSARRVNAWLDAAGIEGGLVVANHGDPDDDTLLLCFTELTTPEDIERLVEALRAFSFQLAASAS